MSELRKLSESMAMRVSRADLDNDQKKALPVIALALKGDMRALHYIGLYDPNGQAIEPPDFETDVSEALERFNRRYNRSSGETGEE